MKYIINRQQINKTQQIKTLDNYTKEIKKLKEKIKNKKFKKL